MMNCHQLTHIKNRVAKKSKILPLICYKFMGEKEKNFYKKSFSFTLIGLCFIDGNSIDSINQLKDKDEKKMNFFTDSVDLNWLTFQTTMFLHYISLRSNDIDIYL